MAAGGRDVLRLQKAAQGFDRYQRGLAGGSRTGDAGGLQIDHAGEAALPIDRRRAGEAGFRRRLEALRVPVRGRARYRGAAGLGQRIGDADEREIVARAAITGERRRHKTLRAVEAQEREIVGLVVGDAFGMAEARNGDGLAAVHHLRRRDDIAAPADHDGGAVFDAAPQPRRRRRIRVRKTLIAIGHGGGDRRHDAFGGLIEQNGDAAQLAAQGLDADDEPFQALHSRHDEGIGRERRMLDGAMAHLLFVVEQSRQRAFVHAECLDGDLAVPRCPAAADAGRRGFGHQRARQAEPRACCRVIDDAPARGLQRRLRRRTDGLDRGIGIVGGRLGGDGALLRRGLCRGLGRRWRRDQRQRCRRQQAEENARFSDPHRRTQRGWFSVAQR